MAKRKRSESDDSDLLLAPEELARKHLLKELNKGLRSRSQLARLLEKLEFEESLIYELLDRYEDVGLIDDKVYARALVNTRRKLKKVSRSVIQRELTVAGIAPEDSAEPLEALDRESELELATELALKKLRTMNSLDSDTQYRRVSGYLARRGFSGGLVSAAIREARQQVN